MEEIPFEKANEIRLKLTEIDATISLQYAALGIAIAVVWATLLTEAWPPWDGSAVWVLEGVIASGGAYSAMLSFFYGGLAGSMGGEWLDRKWEDFDDKRRPTNEKDYLSRIAFRYWKKTQARRFTGKFSTVKSPMLAAFVVVGAVVGYLISLRPH